MLSDHCELSISPELISANHSAKSLRTNSGAEELLGLYFSVLDFGFVSLRDYMGSDSSIARTARTSYGAGTKKINEDKSLIRALMRDHHTSPFEHAELQFHMKLPIFIARQMVRHRTASLNEISGRYSVMSLQFYTPQNEDVRPQSKTNKQGCSEGFLENGTAEWFIEELTNSRENISKVYKKAIESDVAREISRIDLPLSTYTEWVWKMDLHNLFHFLKLRCDAHAQKEIVAFANVMAGITKRCFPLAFDAWIDYQQCAENFSLQELQLLRMVSPTEQDGINLGMSKREFADFVRKTTKDLTSLKFDLDLFLAKSPEFFEKERDKYVPPSFLNK